VGEHKGHVALRPREQTETDDKRPYGFDPERGGVLCRNCYVERGARREIVPLSPDGLWFLRECQRGPYTRLRTLQIAPALHTEVERAMEHYTTYHLERSVKSGTFLRQLRWEQGQMKPVDEAI